MKRSQILALHSIDVMQNQSEKIINHEGWTYGEIADQIGTAPIAMSWVLGWIQTACKELELPPLNVLAYNKNTGVPGGGCIDAPTEEILERIAQHKWNFSKLKNHIRAMN
jgi:hypothetical protein